MFDTTNTLSNSKLLWTVATATVTAVGIGAIMRSSSSSSKKVKKMDDESWESHVSKLHGSLETIFPEKLYRLEAPASSDFGPPTRNMFIYRVAVSNGGYELLIYNAIAVNEETLQEILKLGNPSIMVVPNDMHICCIGVWKKRFPHLKVICFRKPCPTIEQVVPIDCTLTELASHDGSVWKECITVRHIDGWNSFEDILEVKLSTNKVAMIMCDTLFTVPYQADIGPVGRLIQWIFDSYVDVPAHDGKITVPKVSRIVRIFVIRDWKQAEAWFRKYASESIYAILVNYGPPVVELDSSEGCKGALLGVADQLVKPRW